jgi:hypothetical protein
MDSSQPPKNELPLQPAQAEVVKAVVLALLTAGPGSDEEHWWPSRKELNHRTVELEAEATAFIVSSRFGLSGASARCVSRHLGNEPMPPSVSLDLVAKTASRLERMTKETLGVRRERRSRKKQGYLEI